MFAGGFDDLALVIRCGHNHIDFSFSKPVLQPGEKAQFRCEPLGRIREIG